MSLLWYSRTRKSFCGEFGCGEDAVQTSEVGISFVSIAVLRSHSAHAIASLILEDHRLSPLRVDKGVAMFAAVLACGFASAMLHCEATLTAPVR